MPTGNGDSGSGIAANIEFLPFEKEQTYVKMNDDGTLAVAKKMVIFGDGGTSSHLETDFPSVYMEVEAPTAEPKDFAVKAVLAGQNILDENIDVTAGGSGYSDGDTFELVAEGDNTASTFTVNVDADGKITSINGVVDNSEYTKMPTIKAADGVTGTGATFSVDFTNSYKIEIENAGSGYWTKPTLTVATDCRRKAGQLKSTT